MESKKYKYLITAKVMMAKEQIQFVGVSKLSPEDQLVVNQLATEYYPKIKRSLKNVTNLVVHIKEYSKTGDRHKYSLHVRALAPTQVFESSKSSDWDLARALHKAFKDVERQIQHKLHTDEQ